MSEQKKKMILAIILASVLVILLGGVSVTFFPAQQSSSSSTAKPEPAPIGGSAGGPNTASSTPAIFATLSFSNETGFVTTVYPTSGSIEFVLLPNSMGEFTVTYTGIDFNNLTTSFFSVTNPVSVLNVLSNGTLGTGSGLSVTESSVTWVSYYQVVVNYTVTSGGSDGLYVVGLPSTFLSTIVDVGTQPYTGPLTWLEGIFS